MNSRKAHRAYLQSKRNDGPRISREEALRQERREQEKIREEEALRQSRIRAAAARERKRAREEEIRLEKKRKGMPTVDPRASQNTISWFARKPAAKPEPVLEKLVEEPEDDDVALPELRGAEPSKPPETNVPAIDGPGTEPRIEEEDVKKDTGIEAAANSSQRSIDEGGRIRSSQRSTTRNGDGNGNTLQEMLGLSTQDLADDFEDLFPSGTQIAQEIAKVDETSCRDTTPKAASPEVEEAQADVKADLEPEVSFGLGFLSTQDLEITSDDLLEIVGPKPSLPPALDTTPRPPSPRPYNTLYNAPLEGTERGNAAGVATDLPVLSTQDMFLSDDLILPSSPNSHPLQRPSLPPAPQSPTPQPPQRSPTPQQAPGPASPPAVSPSPEEPQPFFTASGTSELISLAILRSKRTAALERQVWRPGPAKQAKPRTARPPPPPNPPRPLQPCAAAPSTHLGNSPTATKKPRLPPPAGKENEEPLLGKKRAGSTPTRGRSKMARVKSDYDDGWWDELEDDDWATVLSATPAKKI